jgi:hypothetical protein
MPATATGRGAQVILDGDAQRAARGAYATTYGGNARYLEDLQRTGIVADGVVTQDGTTRTGAAAADYLVGVADAGAGDGIKVDSSITQITTDFIHNEFTSTVHYTANGTNGDSLGLVSYMYVDANGFNVPNTASQHTAAIYGNGALISAGNVNQVIGVMGVSGNAGSGVLTNGVDFFGHSNYNTGGGTITNHWFLYQEPSAAATNDYGAYFSAPIGIGTATPTYNIQLVSNAGGRVLSTNWMQLGSTTGQFSVGSNGASFFPGYNPGAGGLGVTDLVVGNNGTANPVGATSNFLYISSCPGTPTGGPSQAAIGRIAMTWDTTAHKLWVHDGTRWWGSAAFT